jgi:hypothetical protein
VQFLDQIKRRQYATLLVAMDTRKNPYAQETAAVAGTGEKKTREGCCDSPRIGELEMCGKKDDPSGSRAFPFDSTR